MIIGQQQRPPDNSSATFGRSRPLWRSFVWMVCSLL